MKHYVIPIDFSDNALVAVRFALLLAKKNRVSISLLHAFQPFYSGMQTAIYFNADQERAEQQADRQMKQFLQKLQRLSLYHADDPLIQAVCINGQLIRALVRFHEANEVDLIIFGIGAGPNGNDAQLWSFIYELSKEITVPLLALPNLNRELRLENIGLFTQFQMEETLFLSFLVSVFGTIDVNYRLLSLQRTVDPEDNRRQLKLAKWAAVLCADYEEIKFSVEPLAGNGLAEVLKGINRRSGLDVLVVTKANQIFWKEKTGMLLAKELILASNMPLLIFN